MIHPVVLAVLVTAALGLFLAAVSIMLLHTVKGHRRHHDKEQTRPQKENTEAQQNPADHNGKTSAPGSDERET